MVHKATQAKLPPSPRTIVRACEDNQETKAKVCLKLKVAPIERKNNKAHKGRNKRSRLASNVDDTK